MHTKKQMVRIKVVNWVGTNEGEGKGAYGEDQEEGYWRYKEEDLKQDNAGCDAGWFSEVADIGRYKLKNRWECDFALDYTLVRGILLKVVEFSFLCWARGPRKYAEVVG